MAQAPRIKLQVGINCDPRLHELVAMAEDLVNKIEAEVDLDSAADDWQRHTMLTTVTFAAVRDALVLKVGDHEAVLAGLGTTVVSFLMAADNPAKAMVAFMRLVTDSMARAAQFTTPPVGTVQ